MKYILLALLIFSSAWAEVKIPKVTLEKAALESIESTLFFPVQIKSRIDSKILADNDYIVIKRIVALGQKVKKGDPLLELRRQDTTVHFESRILRAPVSGMVANIHTRAGQYVKVGEPLIHLNDPEDLYGQIEVSAADYKKIKAGLTGKMDLTSINQKDIPVQIQAIGAVVDQVSGTVSVELNITDKMQELVPGIIGLAQITLNKQDKILVPEKALYYIGEEVFIPTLDQKQRVKKIPVKLGKRYKENIEVIAGLEKDMEYIKESAQYLQDGKKVEIQKQ